jgi:hypothetical protein
LCPCDASLPRVSLTRAWCRDPLQEAAAEAAAEAEEAAVEAPRTPSTPKLAVKAAWDAFELDGVSAATISAVRAREAMLSAAATPESVAAREKAKTLGKLRTVFDTLQSLVRVARKETRRGLGRSRWARCQRVGLGQTQPREASPRGVSPEAGGRRGGRSV